MSHLFKATAAIAAVLALAAGASAAVLTYTPHRNVYPVNSDGMNVTDIAVDNANRTWYATNKGGLMAFSGQLPVSGFPIVSDLFTPALSSIAFADADVSGETQENFFIGSNTPPNVDPLSVTGAQYGRVLDAGRISFGTDLCTATPSYEGEITCALVAAHGNDLAAGVVNDLALALGDDPDKLWVATELGVTYLSLPDLTVSSDDMLDAGYALPQATKVIAADPAQSGGVAFYIARGELHMIFGGASPYSDQTFTGLNSLTFPVTVNAIALDASGNLWVAEIATSRSAQRIFRYAAEGLRDWAFNPLPGEEPAPMAAPFSFDPRDSEGSSDYAQDRYINDISVNNSTSELWVATTKGAFFQDLSLGDLLPKLCSLGVDWSDPDDDLDGNSAFCTGPGNGWHPLPQKESEIVRATGENFGAVLSDASANVWLGSDAGFRAVIARLLTLSGTRFIGVGATAGVSLTDITVVDPAPVAVQVTVGDESAFLPLTGSDGDYTVDFGFTYETSNLTSPPYLFQVASTPTGIGIKVTYTFDNGNQELVATASWAEIIPFEDDLWIGGPCMIRAMERK